MKWDYYKKHIKGVITTTRCDISPIFENPKVFNNLIKDMIKPFKKNSYDKIVALDALGFIVGTAIACRTKKPLVLIRKKGKFPYKKSFIFSKGFEDYTGLKKGFEIKKSSIKKGERILIVDEWIETGAQMKIAVELIEKLGGKIIGISTINADRNKKIEILFNKYNCRSLR
jgi:adenine phosphoribosyltransferase